MSRIKLHIKQRGVALIQVLLITFMMIILTIQLNREAQLEVRLATQLKTKLLLELEAANITERVKFALLTENRAGAVSQVLNSNWNFYGKPVQLNSKVKLSLQDEAGRISLPYGGQELVQWLGGETLYNNVMNYQGMGLAPDIAPGMRGGYMQSLDEVRFVNGWQQSGHMSGITHMPTQYFNLFNSPDSLIDTLFSGQGQAETIKQMRTSGNARVLDWKAVIGSQLDFMLTTEPSSKVVISVVATSGDILLQRHERFWVEPLNHDPILRIMN